jgi:rhamnose utilization protein RhaD (predicted bifunctional aldolase and dehydrogenase)
MRSSRSNQRDGVSVGTLGDEVTIVEYVTPGFCSRGPLPGVRGGPAARMVWIHHGIITWGATARDA